MKTFLLHPIPRRVAAAMATTLASMCCAVPIWTASAGTALAPEPARLNGALTASSVPATYVDSSVKTNAYFLSSTSWTLSSIPAGAPCSTTWGLAAGTTIYSVVQASGNYRKCQ